MLSEHRFLQQIGTIFPDFKSKKFLLAISGGSDSMVLLHLFKALNAEFQVAHVNYKLRGKDSDLDQDFVETYCKRNDIKFHCYSVKNEEKPQNSIQLWARNLRYQFFRKIVNQEKLDFISTAHHLNDELETFIINLSRGSGIRGLSGIPEIENAIIRPLLHFSKTEILEYAKRNSIDFRDDKSNFKDDYLRNQIRHYLVPELLKTNPKFLKNFSKSIFLLRETKNLVEENIHQIFSEITLKNTNLLTLSKPKLQEQRSFVQYEILRKFGFENSKEIQKILNARTGSIFQSSTYKLWIQWDTLVLEKQNLEIAKIEEISEHILPLPTSTREISLTQYVTEVSKHQIWKYRTDKISFPLKLRRKKAGDIFFPIGMKGKKKISKYCKDEKIPTFERKKIWILTDAKDQILGIVGFRQDRRFAADEQTKNVCIVSF